MNAALFWRLFLAHTAADFALQPDALIKAKRSAWGIAVHAGIFGIAMAATLREYLDSRDILIVLFSLTLFHFAVDFAKCRLQKAIGRESIWLFLGDQALHVGSILLAAYVLRFYVRITYEPAFAPLALAIIGIWGGPIIFQTARAEITGNYFKPHTTLGSARGNLNLLENGVLFAVGLQFGWFLLGLVLLVPRIIGWAKGKNMGVVPLSWALAIALGMISRFILLKL
ncbi:MAG TPA: DUF3307 domain-containing protein [candidate division Zixibacteria bacterium]|nr:DUF3307 domain-containing protein [candidate division Zixibacteria bacterium]